MNTRNGIEGRTRSTFVLALLAAASWACGSGGRDEPQEAKTKQAMHEGAGGEVVLRDRTGAAIAPGSTTPYSPEKTCGGCHDTSVITRGYHFQQGRTNAQNQIQVADNFNTGKPWLLSDGMYGKW